jgi:hypothetical protein
MSKTYCRFCDITADGLYLHCPRCGGWLPGKENLPAGEPGVINPEPFDLVEFGKSWDYKIKAEAPQEDNSEMNEETKKEYERRRAILPKRYPLPVRIALGIIEAILYLGAIAIALGIVGLMVAGMAWLIVTVAI